MNNHKKQIVALTIGLALLGSAMTSTVFAMEVTKDELNRFLTTGSVVGMTPNQKETVFVTLWSVLVQTFGKNDPSIRNKALAAIKGSSKQKLTDAINETATYWRKVLKHQFSLVGPSEELTNASINIAKLINLLEQIKNTL